jgi:hypothetical protein
VRVKFVSSTPTPASEDTLETPTIIRPERRVLVRKILGVAVLIIVFAILPTVLSQVTRADAAPRNYLPGFALLSGMLGLHLLFLTRALFVTLNRDAEVRIHPDRLEVRLDGGTQCLAWGDIRQMQFGDIHFRILTRDGTLEIPFLAKRDQQLLYRLHYRHTGLTPDEGRFLALPGGDPRP